MNKNDYISCAYNGALDLFNEYIYKKGVKKSWLAASYGCSRTTLNSYLDGSNDIPFKFALFMRQLMKSDPCN